MATDTNTTTDHDEIRRWAEVRGGRPVQVRGTQRDYAAGVLRIDLPGGAGEEEFEPIPWADWFAKFDAAGLAFVCQEQQADGSPSTFHKLVRR